MAFSVSVLLITIAGTYKLTWKRKTISVQRGAKDHGQTHKEIHTWQTI